MKFKIIFLLPILSILMAAAQQFFFDDRNSMFSYSSSTVGTSDQAYNGTYRYVTQNNSITFKFDGDTLEVYQLRYQYGSVASLYIDGELLASKTANYSNNPVSQLAFSVTALGSGEHTASIVVSDTYMPSYASASSAPRFYFDYIVTSSYYSDNMLQILQIWLVLGVLCILVLDFFSGAIWRLKIKND